MEAALQSTECIASIYCDSEILCLGSTSMPQAAEI